jgi:hypothetical protein
MEEAKTNLDDVLNVGLVLSGVFLGVAVTLLCSVFQPQPTPTSTCFDLLDKEHQVFDRLVSTTQECIDGWQSTLNEGAPQPSPATPYCGNWPPEPCAKPTSTYKLNTNYLQ